LQQNDSSRFLAEIPEEDLDKSYAGGGMKNSAGSGWGAGIERMQRRMGAGTDWKSSSTASQAEKKYGAPPGKSSPPGYMNPKPVQKLVEHKATADFVASDTSNLQVGQKLSIKNSDLAK
jgi:DNA helicase-2/ATP-dependent DNA helicase PcrA